MVSIKGRSHTSANLDLEINEESKNKEIVRITLPFLVIGITEHSLYGRVVLKKMIQKIPGRSQNNRAKRRMLVILPISRKK